MLSNSSGQNNNHLVSKRGVSIFVLLIASVCAFYMSGTAYRKEGPTTASLMFTPELVVVESSDGKQPRNEVQVIAANRGAEPIKIVAVEPSCSCATILDVSPRTITPNSSSVIRLNVRTPRFGVKESDVRVITDQAENPVSVFKIRAEGPAQTKPFVVSGSRSFSISGSGAGNRVTQEIVIRTVELSSNEVAWISGVRSNNANSKVRIMSRQVERVLDEQRTQFAYRIEIDTNLPGDEEGARNEVISVQTRTEGMVAPGEWLVRVTNTPRVQAFPGVVRYFFSPGRENKEMSVILRSAREFRIVSATSDVPWCSVEVIDNLTPAMKKIGVSVDESLLVDSGKPEGLITAIVETPERYDMKLPIVAMMKYTSHGPD